MNEAITIGIRILEVLFFGGMAGSLILIVITAVEDMETVLSPDEPETTDDKDAQP